jgi:hypothetical protein
MRRSPKKFRLNFNRLNGGRTRTRTWDPLIKSQLLYQLSYAPGLLRLVIAKRRGLAKAIATVQPRP